MVRAGVGHGPTSHRGREPQARRFDLGLGLAIVIGVVIAGIVGPATDEPTADPVTPTPPRTTTVDHEVRLILTSLRGAWTPAAFRRIAAGSPEVLARHEAGLAKVLADPADPLFEQAVRLAVHQQRTQLVPQLRAALADASELARQLLVGQVDTLEPWTDQELAELLESDSRGIVLGALQLAASRPRPPLDQIATLLVADDAAIRAAALAALPNPVPVALGNRILAVLRTLPADQSGAALAALTHCPATPEIEDTLYAQLEQQTDHCELVLDALARRRTPLTRPDPVHRIVQNALLPLSTRARALRCLETTGTDAAALLEHLQFHHPVLDYLAARVQVQARQLAGVERLLRVVRTREEDYEAEEARMAQEAHAGARQLLALLAGTAIYAEVSQWEEWAATQRSLEVESLPAVTVTLDG